MSSAQSHSSIGSLRSTSASSISSIDDHSNDFFLNNHSNDFFLNNQRFIFIKELCDSKFSVYLTKDTKTNQLQALKLFPWNEEDDQPCPFFTKEVRFAQISHPNVISIHDYKIEQEILSENVKKVSYITMDYAKNGDLFEALITLRIPFNETLLRTYFRQIIFGLEAIHSRDAAHLDLKLENILLDENFAIKIIDFDLSFMPEDKIINSRGTENYRAPEIVKNICQDGKLADIYSLAIILFLLKTGGKLPFLENRTYHGIDMKYLLQTNPKLFWEKHCQLLGKPSSFFTEEFKELFERMAKQNPLERPTINEIKSSAWFQQEIYSEGEVFDFMSKKFNLA